MAKKENINAYKNRMDAPMGVVRIDPKTKKPIKSNKNTKKGGK